MTDRPTTLRRRLALPLALLGLFMVSAASASGASQPRVDVLTAEGIVDNVMAGYIADGVAQGASDGAAAVVIKLNTPGGSLDSTQKITGALLESTVPTIVWVAPSGGRAASAGTFITLAANLAYMAPGTNIGAASPVDSSGGDITGTLGVKVMNDAVANITAIAEARGRPVDWAVSTVKDAASYSANEAVAAGAVDGIAATLDEVLAAANGQVVTVAGGQAITLDLAGAAINEAPMSPGQGFLHLLSDPNIAFLLFVLGGLGLAIELVHPNLLTGIVGSLCLILAFIGFGSLPLNVAGLLLVGLGLLLFVLETQITSHGLLTVAGIVCFVLGASALYGAPGNLAEPAVQVATPLIVVTTGMAAVLMGLIAVAAVRTRRMKASAGTVGVPVPLGSEGYVQAPLEPLGTVYLADEPWSGRTADGTTLARDTLVRLVRFDGLVAIVEPINPFDAGPAPPAPAGQS
ncbi:MAG TPA: NfeD family protein [Candidatus Limnocylindrales bacterium]|jgi:membrane-bound serine protease (ClpP class)